MTVTQPKRSTRYTVTPNAVTEESFELSPLAAEHVTVELSAWSLAHGRGVSAFGTIVAEGEGVADRGELLGCQALLPALLACGACLPCRRAHPFACESRIPDLGLVDHAQVPARLVVRLRPHGAAPLLGTLTAPEHAHRLAALSDVGLFAYAAVIRASVEPNRAAIIIGEGPLARFIAALVQHRGAHPIRVTELATGEAIVRGALAARGLPYFGIPLIDAGGATDSGAALTLAVPGSTVVLCDVAGAAKIDTRLMVERELSVHGLRGAHPDLLPELVAFVSKGNLALDALVHEAPDLLALSSSVADERVPLWVRPSAG